MPVKRCGPLKLIKRKKENDANKTDENCYSSPTKKIKPFNGQKVLFLFQTLLFIFKYLFKFYYKRLMMFELSNLFTNLIRHLL